MQPPAPTGTRSHRVAFLIAPVLGAAVLIAALTGLVPDLAALAIAVGGVALWATVVLVHTALAIHHRDGTFAACRGAGFIGMAALVTGVTAGLLYLGPPHQGIYLAAGVGAVATLYVLGTMLLPGAASTAAVRLRRAFDGLGLGVALGFAAYLMRPLGKAPYSTLVCTLLAATGISIVTVIVLRARLHRPAALRCGLGAILVLLALSTVANLVLSGHDDWIVALFGLPIVAGLALTAEGGSRRNLPESLPPREQDLYLSGYPLLALPAGIGVIAALYHLIFVGNFDPTAISLGIAMVAILTMRELLVVSDIRRYTGQLRTKEAHFRSLVAGATDLTLVLDDKLTVRWQSPAAARLFGLADSEVVGRTFINLLHPDDAAGAQAGIETLLAGEHDDGPPALLNARIRDGHGMWRDTESTVADQRSVPEVSALVVHVRDVGERRHLERTLHKLSYTDQLTGLANRRALMRDLLAYRRRAGQQGTVLVIDLHGLAEINDSKGREIGDAVLIEVGRRIRSLLGEEDVAARLGGDEFAVLTADGAVLAYALATRIVTLLMEPYQLPGTIVELHTSVGLAELAGGNDSEEVLRHADLARSRARQLGRDRVEWYDTDVEIQLHRRMDLERELLGAADRGELDLVFQPVVSLSDTQPVGVEALLRWRHPKLGTILPAELLPIARAVGCAADLDEWVLDAACRHLSSWPGGNNEFWLSVNVSPRELLSARFPETVAEILARHRLEPERLVVEVQETWVAEDVPAIVASLTGLRKLGVRAALDDFGAGQASLSHLRRLPVDMLKLDQGLVNTPAEPPIGPAVIDVVVSLGKRLGLEIVAKGLETQEQIDRARRAGCLYGQGFALARPAPAERMEAYLDSHRA
ncbi:putative diguanylate cyclase/phosphodiesterase with PAS sensor [Actinoplanes friuliensis DSM 7358]|uniref:Putative diguanylate cyclase/phosphodiesterase with PAS sensor n=1 Tax=Actinoplanes friuliensis DSM 7358 TaxID=1246995 RepID=U5WCJ5_9ACTN|nr:putative diguanylate cyclase/phosphodiesterase with PAS sensor [Actinoplanes friuliensis DSM 7358]